MRRFVKALQAVVLVGAMTVTTAVGASTVFADSSTYTSTTGGENALSVSSGSETYDGITVTKSGDSNDENADFTGTNAAVLASNGATLTITNSDISSNGSHANAVFSYGTGTTVNISDSTITTSGNNSGGIMTTGGGTMNAENLTVNTSGNSSAAIRSDRGGGDVNVTGGTYSTTGVGSPAIYSTADIDVTDATLSSSSSEGVVVEGANSVSLTDTDLTASNTVQNSDNTDVYKGVMIYQSMSGDADQGTASFSMDGGTFTNENGSLFYVTNTTATIDLNDVTIVNNDDDVLLTIQQDGWGTSGSNGGNVTFTATDQDLTGSITVDSASYLNYTLTGDSNYTGSINTSGSEGTVVVTVDEGSTWTLDGDTYITGLTNNGTIDTNGYTLYVNGTAYTSVESGQTYGDTSATADTSTDNGNSSQDTTDNTSDTTTDNGQSTDQNTDQNTDQTGNMGGFEDVDSSSYYFKPVQWAFMKGITSGTSSTTFSPDLDCTRGQIIALLYRAAGSPDVTYDGRFEDVDSDDYYAKAVEWAAENGITSGTSDTTFDPEAVCTRAQAVQLLYKYMQTQDSSTDSSSSTSDNTFTDVLDNAYYRDAVDWAVANSVTSGTSSTTFSPDKSCTRAEIVTFLYNALGSDDMMTPPTSTDGSTTPPALPSDSTASSTDSSSSTTLPPALPGESTSSSTDSSSSTDTSAAA